MNCDDFRSLVDPYVDGELDLVRILEFEGHVKECPVCGPMLERRRSVCAAVREAPLRFFPSQRFKREVLGKLRAVADDSPTTGATPPENPPEAVRRWSWPSWFAGIASGAVIAAVLIGLLPRFTGPSREDAMVRELIGCHVRSLMAGHLTDVETSNQHVVKPWFNGRLDFSPATRDFSGQGFPLIGGRLDYAANRAVAALVYRRALHPINLFVWPSAGTAVTGPGVVTRQGYNLVRWIKGGTAYCLVSDLNVNELRDFAGLIQKED